jgi:hypothetical protein
MLILRVWSNALSWTYKLKVAERIVAPTGIAEVSKRKTPLAIASHLPLVTPPLIETV